MGSGTRGLRLRTPREGVLFHSQPTRVVLLFPRGGWGLWGKGLFFAASAALGSGGPLPNPELVPTDYSHPRWPCTQDAGDFGFCCRGRDARTRQKSLAWSSDPGGKGLAVQNHCVQRACPGVQISNPSCPSFLRPTAAPGPHPAGPPLSQRKADWEEEASCLASPGTSALSALVHIRRATPSKSRHPLNSVGPGRYGPKRVNTAM